MLGGEFLYGGGNLRRSDFDHSKLKNNIVKILSVWVKVNFVGRRIFLIGWWKFEARGQVIEYNKKNFFQKFCRK